jgi:hypothetical protein
VTLGLTLSTVKPLCSLKKVTRSISPEMLSANCIVGFGCKTVLDWEQTAARACLPIMMHQRFDLAVVQLANPFK